MSPICGPVLDGWLRGEKELSEGEGPEGERGRGPAAPGRRRNSPAEVSSAWCAVLHLRLTLEHELFDSQDLVFDEVLTLTFECGGCD